MLGSDRVPIARSGSTNAYAATINEIAALTAAGVFNENYIDNSSFTVNQRGYTSGTAIAAAAYAHDRWKAGSGGCTYTFTATPAATQITITAGTLQQIVEGAGLLTGAYTLSWQGTAQGRIGAGSYAASPIAVSGTAGSNLTIEFNTGTLSRVKLELGSVASTWQPRRVQQEMAACQRFYQLGNLTNYGYIGAGNGSITTYLLPVRMRILPPTVNYNFTTTTNINTMVVGSLAADSIYMQFTGTALGGYAAVAAWNASADL